MTTTPAIVDAPVVTPAGYGLLSVAQFPAADRFELGVTWEEHGAAQAFTAEGWYNASLAAVVSEGAGTDQVQTLTLTGPPTGGTYSLSGSAPIAFDAVAADIQTAVRGVPGYGDAVVAGAGPFTITFPAADGSLPVLVADNTNLVGGTADVAITTQAVAPGLATTDEGIVWGESAVVTVFSVFDASIVGRDPALAAQLAKLKLDYAAPRALEKAIWTGKDTAAAAITGKHLADASTTVLGGGTVTDPATGVGLLEEWLGLNYAGQGVIHAPRRAGATFDRFQLHNTVSGHKETGLGNRVALGVGYDGSDKTGAAAPAGEAWLYATAAVAIRQGEDVVVPDAAHGLNRLNNRLTIVAERQYLVAWEAAAAAVLVTLGA